jgi:hypothetical protein
MAGVSLDLKLLQDKALFQKIKEQSDVVENLFSALANDFPQSELSKFHPESKGTKISKGYNLENAPYQVLDLVRDFDSKKGFNIRILNWWGKGLFIFVYMGYLTYEKKLFFLANLLESYQDCQHSSPWAYGSIINGQTANEVQNSENLSVNQDFFQVFKQIVPSSEISETHLMLKKEIRFILDNPY